MAHSDLVLSLAKGLEILKLIGEAPDGLHLTEIAQSLGWKTPATHNLVRTLCAKGFASKRSDGHFVIGEALLEVAENQARHTHHQALEACLLKLHQALSKATIIHARLSGGEVRQTHRLSPERPGVIQRLEGDVLHPYASAAGLLGLAYAEKAGRHLVEEARPFAEHGAHLWGTRAKFEAFLEDARKNNAVESPFETDLTLRMAVGVLDAKGLLRGILGASLPRSEVRDTGERGRVLATLTEAANTPMPI